MALFDRIPNPSGPEVIPAVAERSYPDVFYTQMSFVAIPGCDQMEIRWRPYNHDAGELKPDTEEVIHNEPGLWALAEQYGAVKVAMGAVIQAATLLLYLRKAQADAVAPLKAAADATDTRDSKEVALEVANANAAVAQIDLDNAKADLAAKQATLAGLPADAADEEKAAAQASVDVAVSTVATETDTLAMEQAMAATAMAELATAEATRLTAQSAADAAQAAVAAIETKLGK